MKYEVPISRVGLYTDVFESGDRWEGEIDPADEE